MKRAIIAIAALALFLAPMNAIAAIKTGDVCKKAGTTATAGGKKFTCIKSGKKLVWNKGVAVVNPKPPTPTPAPTPIATPTPSPTPTVYVPPTPITTPTPAPIVEKAPTGFADLVENYRGIPGVVWNEAQTLLQQGSAASAFSVEVGPNTKIQAGLEDPQIYLEQASRLWSKVNQPKTTKVFLFSFPDLAWAQQKLVALGGSWFTASDLAGNCARLNSCGSFGGTYRGVGQIFIGVPVREYTQFNLGYVRGNYAHEFTHVVQYAQFADQPTINGYAIMPCWFSEGQPQVPGTALGFQTLTDYRNQRVSWFSQPAGALGDYSPEAILKFYSLTGSPRNGECNANVRKRVYDVGYITVEALAAIKGIYSTIELVKNVANGLKFEDSFKKVYGISWTEAAPILAKVVSLQFSNP
jgi:hypothetical protein